jgi:hypothetical protein
MPWYKIECLFDQKAQKVMQIGDADILLREMYYVKSENGKTGEPELAICQVPTAIGRAQGANLQHLLEANLRVPVVVLTNNINMVKLKAVTDEEAEKVLGKQWAEANNTKESN